MKNKMKGVIILGVLLGIFTTMLYDDFVDRLTYCGFLLAIELVAYALDKITDD